MERAIEVYPELTTRRVRQWFVAYRKDAYPCYGEGLPLLGYLEFKAKIRVHEQLSRQLTELYERFPRLSSAPAEDRARMVHLEALASQLERELCIS